MYIVHVFSCNVLQAPIHLKFLLYFTFGKQKENINKIPLLNTKTTFYSLPTSLGYTCVCVWHLIRHNNNNGNKPNTIGCCCTFIVRYVPDYVIQFYVITSPCIALPYSCFLLSCSTVRFFFSHGWAHSHSEKKDDRWGIYFRGKQENRKQTVRYLKIHDDIWGVRWVRQVGITSLCEWVRENDFWIAALTFFSRSVRLCNVCGRVVRKLLPPTHAHPPGPHGRLCVLHLAQRNVAPVCELSVCVCMRVCIRSHLISLSLDSTRADCVYILYVDITYAQEQQ